MIRCNIKKLIKFTSVSFAVVIMASISLTFYLIFTNAGTKILIKNLSYSQQNNIKIEEVSGTLASKINIPEIIIKKDALTIRLQDSELKINPFSIMTKKIKLSYFKTKKASVNIANLVDIPIESINSNLLIQSDNILGQLSYKIPEYKFENTININGKIDNYNIKSNIKVDGHTTQIIGKGNKEILKLKNIGNDLLETDLYLSWKQGFKLDFNINGKLEIPESDTTLELDGFKINALNDNYNIKFNKINGSLNGKSLIAIANLNYSPNEITGYTNISYSNNKIDFLAQPMPNNTMSIKAKIPKINEIFKEIQGSIKAEMNISGAADTPEISLKYNTENLSTNNISIRDSAGNIKIDKDNNINAMIKINSVISEYDNIDSITTSLTGSLKNHKSILRLTNKEQIINTTILGSYDNSEWDGKIESLEYKVKNNLLKLQNLPKITYKNNLIKLSKACLAQQKDDLCISGRIDIKMGTWAIAAESTSFDLSKIGGINILNKASIKEGILEGNIGIIRDNITQIEGSVTLKDALLYIPKQNVYYKIGSAGLVMNKNNNRIDGNIHTTDGKLNIEGNCKLNDCRLSIIGDDFQLMNTRTLKLTTKPNIKVLLKNGLAKITGLITVFKSELLINTEANALTLPSDVHVKSSIPKQNSIDLDPKSAVELVLTDDNVIKLGYTTGKITGKITLSPRYKNTLIANGMLSLIDAKYKGYGQDLTIKKGNIKYDNDTIDNPEIDIEAVRIIDSSFADTGPKSLEESVAGIKVTGQALKPSIELFSSPEQLNYNEILSLIITGKRQSFNDDQINNESFDPYTLGSYLLESTGAFKQLSSNLSLEKLSIIEDNDMSNMDASEISTSTKNGLKVLISKRLNDKFLLSGRFGMYSNDYTLSAQYKLSDKIILKGYINELSHGLNILYKLSSD